MDECAEDTDQCAQICDNQIGSYICKCRVGYVLSKDGLGCDGKIFTN